MTDPIDPLSRLANAEVQSAHGSPGSKIRQAGLAQQKTALLSFAGIAVLVIGAIAAAGRIVYAPGEDPEAAAALKAARSGGGQGLAGPAGGAGAAENAADPQFASAGPTGTAGRMSAMFGAARDDSALATELKKAEFQRVTVKSAGISGITTAAEEKKLEERRTPAPEAAPAAPVPTTTAAVKREEPALAKERTIVYGVTDRRQLMGRAAGPVLNVKGKTNLSTKRTPDKLGEDQEEEDEIKKEIAEKAAEATDQAQTALNQVHGASSSSQK